MSRNRSAGMLALAALTLGACNGDAAYEEERQGLLVVGSSTIYPFANAMAETLARAAPDLPASTIRSTGTGEGIEAFCAGAGLDTPDIVNASRRMTRVEFDGCAANGVTDIAELQVGLDGIAFVSALDDGIDLSLTPPVLYRALAAQPFGETQSTYSWSEVDPALPDQQITVYGPPASSGTRDALKELVMVKGCETNGRMGALKDTDPEQFALFCGALRSGDGYFDQGEEDDTVVRKVANNPVAVAIVGFSYLEENMDKVKPLPINGIVPTAQTIASGEYPLTRPLYLYVKKAHLESIPALHPYVAQWADNWGDGGSLSGIGFVPAHADVQQASSAAAESLPNLTADALD